MSCKAAAKKFKVPRSTLQRKLKDSGSAEDRKVGPEAVLGRTNEETLVQWASHLSAMGFPATKTQLLDSVARLVRYGKINVPFKNDRPGRKWYASFLKRHPILAERTSQNLTRSRANVTKEDLIQWSVKVETYLKRKDLFNILKDPTRVFNADEFALFLSPKPGCVLAKKGDKNVYSVV
nr:PREDICTED: uncharacterized protein LOC109034731 [Bemisia tabaci]